MSTIADLTDEELTEAKINAKQSSLVMTKDDFLAWEAASRDTIDVKRCYCDIAGDLIAGIILSQIVFWHLPGENGKSKLRVTDQDGRPSLAKNHGDWWDECRVTENQAPTALNRLKEAGLIVKRNGMFNGKKTPMITLNWPVFLAAITENTNSQGIADAASTDQPIVAKSVNRSYRKRRIGKGKRASPIT